MGSNSWKGWVEVIVAAVLALLLSFITLSVGDYRIVLTVLPLVFISLRRGLLQGLFAGALTGIIIYILNYNSEDMLQNVVLHFGPVAFVGISGFFAKFTQRTLNNKRFPNAALNIVTGSFFGTLLYFVWNFIGSVSFDPAGVNDTGYYLRIDGVSWLLTFAVTAIVLLILAKVAPKSYIPKDTRFLSRKEKSKLLND